MPSQAFVTPLALPHLSPPSATTTTRAPTVAALSHPASSSTLHLDWLPTQPLPSPTPSPAHTYTTAPTPTLTPAQAAWSARIAALTAPVDNSPAAAETFPAAADTSLVASNTSPAASRTSAQPSEPTPVVPKAPPAPTAAHIALSERIARLAREAQAEVEAPAVAFSARAVPAFAPPPKSVYEARMERMARIVAGEVEACEDVAEASDRWDRFGVYADRGVVQVKKAERSGRESKSGGFIVKFQSSFWSKSGTKNTEAAPVSSVAAPGRAAGDSAKGGREGWKASSARQALLKKDAASKVGAATGVAQAGASADRGIGGRSRVVSAVTNEGDAVSGGGAMALDGGDVMESHNVEVALSSTILAVFFGVCLTVSERFSEIAHHAAGSGMM